MKRFLTLAPNFASFKSSASLVLFLILSSVIITSCQSVSTQDSDDSKSSFRDIYPDTWVATDALGRTMPGIDSVGDVKNDKERVVGIFYITWHLAEFAKLENPINYNITKILQKNPEARLDGRHPAWGENPPYFFWDEPEMGYFLSQDEYVIRKDISMLADAGVDVLIMDVTNGVRYWDEWEITFSIIQQMKAEGNKVPKIVFWAFNGDVITVVQNLYDEIYKKERFKDLWFYWDGKPLLLYNAEPALDANTTEVKQHSNPHFDPDAITNKDNPHFGDPDYTEEYYKDYTADVKNFFTLRTMWWGYYEWAGKRFVGTEDNWSFGYNLADQNVKKMSPKELLSTHKGQQEQFAVTAAQHPVSLSLDDPIGVGKSWSRKSKQPMLNEYDLPEPTYVPWLGDTVEHPEGYGIYFQERWDEAVEADPAFIYLNDWNEWTAGKFNPQPGGGIAHTPSDETISWLGRTSSFLFVDQYNSEFNRCIHPMKGGYSDNYYMQMAQNIRRYKGARPIPENSDYTNVKIDGKFKEWESVDIEYRDTKGDVFHRDHPGYGGIHYKNESGRNDIITSKVAVNKKNINFFVETAQPLTSHNDNGWMLLLIDSDNNSTTGWFGYDFMVNRKVKDSENTVLMEYDNKAQQWKETALLEIRYSGNKMELAIEREIVGLTDNSIVLNFKWSDNPGELKDPISFCLNGDTAPNRRFNYRFKWTK